jgi:hypothetical protein
MTEELKFLKQTRGLNCPHNLKHYGNANNYRSNHRGGLFRPCDSLAHHSVNGGK